MVVIVQLSTRGERRSVKESHKIESDVICVGYMVSLRLFTRKGRILW